MAFPAWRLGVLAILLLGCGSGSSGTPPSDAGGTDAARGDAADGGACFPFCGDAGRGGDATGDVNVSCDQQKVLVETLQAKAKACDPRFSNQCTATTNDPCCPITITSSNVQAVNDFDQAVATYKSECSPDCSREICQPAPSNVCDAPQGSTQGVCR